MFARLANGNVTPVRVIQGQATKLSRTTHGIDYDPVHDEIVAPNPLAAAVVVYRGGANGDEAPIRVIQGVQTQLSRPETVAVDTKNDELLVGDPGTRSVLIYPRTLNGDGRPIRVIQGLKTKLHQVVGIGVDPIRDLLVVSSYSRTGGVTGLLIFNRRDEGDVAPRAVIAGEKTGILRLRQIAVDPEAGKIFVAAINNEYMPPYELDRPRKGLAKDVDLPSPWAGEAEGFIGVWNITDHGDVPPVARIKGRSTGVVHPAGVAFNARDGEIIALDSVWNGMFTFLIPEVFAKPRTD